MTVRRPTVSAPETILILEDDEGVARLQQRRLERAGFTVRWAAAPGPALEHIHAGGIDLLLLDNRLTAAEDGLDFYKRLKAAGLDLPVILVTGYSDDATLIQALRAGVSDYIFKSVEYLDYLPEAARRVLDQVRTEKQLAGSQALLRAVMNETLDAIILLDESLRVTLFNPAAEEVFGPAAAAVGSDVTRFLPGRLPPHACAGAARRATPQEVEGRRASGAPVPLEVTCSRVELPGQTLYELILRDVSERKRALAELRAKSEELRSTTQQLWQAAKLAGVGELAASIAHELNNPLGTVSLRVEGILAKTPADDPRRKPLEIVEQEVSRMARLVGNLLQFSRAGREQVSTVNVCEEIDKTIELTDYHLIRRGVRIEPDYQLGVPPIFADRQQLRQVFLNLFTNAGDAMHEGGVLVPRVRTGELAGKPAVVIEVIDTGAGIPPEHLPYVLDPFFTTKEDGKGTGLGLAICRRIVHQHLGTLQIESAVGKGTTVRITLPVRHGANVDGLS
jgi:PAS domain S-box-containing protein